MLRPGRFTLGLPRLPFYRRLGGSQGRSEQLRKISPPTWIRSPDRPARSESLYPLSYPGQHITPTRISKCNNVPLIFYGFVSCN